MADFFFPVSSKVLLVLLAITFVLSYAVGQAAVTLLSFRKQLCQIKQIKSPSSYALRVHLCFNYLRPVRFNTRLNQPKVFSSMHIDPFGHAELPRAAFSEFGVDIFLKTSSVNLPTLLNCRSELHLTTHQTQILTHQTTKVVSLGKLLVVVHVWTCTMPNSSTRIGICVIFMIIPRAN